MKRYRLQFFDRSEPKIFAINWVAGPGRVAGDCRVRAIAGTTDPDAHNRASHQRQRYSEPLTLDEARAYVAANAAGLGTLIHDCVGLQLEDGTPDVDFAEPIQVRNG